MEELAGSYWAIQNLNIDGTVATLALPEVGGLPREGITFTYNGLGMPNRMVGSLITTGETQVYVDSTTYTAWGEMAQRTLAASYENQVYQTNSYEDGTRRRGEFRLSRDAVGATNVAHLRYDYDHAGNILSIADAVEDPPGQPQRQCFVYDHLRRLSEAWTQAGVDPCTAQPSIDAIGGPGAYWSSYTFDVTGNRLSETRHDPSGGSHISTYSYPPHGGPQPHTLSSVTTGSRTNTYTWDAAGNMTSRTIDGQTETIQWSPAGKPAAIADDNGNTTRMLYNQDGNRIARIDGNGDANLFIAGHEITYTKATDTVTAVRSYEHNGDLIATRSTTDGLQWLASDHHGTATWAINATTMAVTHRRQDPYGNPRDPQQHWPAGQRGFVYWTPDGRRGGPANRPPAPRTSSPGHAGNPLAVATNHVFGNGTRLVILGNGQVFINGYQLPAGHPDPWALAAWVDNGFGDGRIPDHYFEFRLTGDAVMDTILKIEARCQRSRWTYGDDFCSVDFHGEVEDDLDNPGGGPTNGLCIGGRVPVLGGRTAEGFVCAAWDAWGGSGIGVVTHGRVGFGTNPIPTVFVGPQYWDATIKDLSGCQPLASVGLTYMFGSASGTRNESGERSYNLRAVSRQAPAVLGS